MDPGEPSFWTVAPISAIVSAFVALGIRYFDKPRPRLALYGRMYGVPANSQFTHDDLGARATLMNVGNGPAFDLQVVGSDCVVGLIQEGVTVVTAGSPDYFDRLPALLPSESTLVHIHNHSSGEPRVTVTYPVFPAVPWLAAIKRSRQWVVKDLPIMSPFPPQMLEAKTIPGLRRKLGIVQKFGIVHRFDAEMKDTEPDDKPPA